MGIKPKSKWSGWGENHHHAVLTDHEVDLLLQLREDTSWGYLRLAKKFEISKSHVRRIIKGQARRMRAG